MKKKPRIKDLVKSDLEKYKKVSEVFEEKKSVEVIYLDLSSDDFYAEYSNESLLKNEVFELIEDTYDVFVTGKKKFKLGITFPNDMPEEEKEKITGLIKVHYAIELDEIKKDIQHEYLVGSIVFIVGLLILIGSIFMQEITRVVGKVLEIISWTFIWEAVLRFFLQNTAHYRDRQKFRELYLMAREYHRERKN